MLIFVCFHLLHGDLKHHLRDTVDKISINADPIFLFIVTQSTCWRLLCEAFLSFYLVCVHSEGPSVISHI